MTRVIIVAAILLGGLVATQAAPFEAHRHFAGVSSCVARQRADLAPLDRFGGYPPYPAGAPAFVQNVLNSALDEARTRCLPRRRRPLDWTDFLPPN